MIGWLRRRLGGAPAERTPAPAPGPKVHVVLVDGTMSSLEPGRETSVGLIWRMLERDGRACLHYEPGIAWRGWRHAREVAAGVGVNAQMRRAYAFLARAWAPGDRVYLIGYSRGAYVVRALAGMVGRVGLLRAEHATDALVDAAYAQFRDDPTTPEARRWAAAYCHDAVPVEAVACFDTVRAVGVRAPVLWRLFPEVDVFRSHRLGAHVRRGLHALALQERRRAFAPDLWETFGGDRRVEQVWFRGAHADVGGHVGIRPAARGLANVPLAWMLGRLAAAGLPLPDDWRARLPTDPDGPMVGTWRGWGPLFLWREARAVGRDPSERLHPAAKGAEPPEANLPLWIERPLAVPTADPRPRGWAGSSAP